MPESKDLYISIDRSYWAFDREGGKVKSHKDCTEGGTEFNEGTNLGRFF